MGKILSSNRLVATSDAVTERNSQAKLYGNGVDGTVVISTNTFLSRDMYYDSLTVNSSVTLFTNGFKVFVKNTLTNNGTIGMPASLAQTTSVLAGSVITRMTSSDGYSANSALDGNAPASITKNLDEIIGGTYQTGESISRYFVGQAGSAGTSNPGNPGSGGGSNAGNPGSGGSAGMAGGAVVVLAKTISGTGNFISSGTAGGAGNPGSAGNSVNGNVGHNPGGHVTHGHGHCNDYGNCGAHHARPDNPNHCHYHHPASGCNAAPHHNHPGNAYHNPSYPGGTAGSGNPGNAGAQGALMVASTTMNPGVTMDNTLYESIIDL